MKKDNSKIIIPLTEFDVSEFMELVQGSHRLKSIDWVMEDSNGKFIDVKFIPDNGEEGYM